MSHHRRTRPALPEGIGTRPRAAVILLLCLGLLLVGVGSSVADPAPDGLGVPAAGPAELTGGEVRPSSGARASGLPWHSGVFSHDAARTAEFDKTRGRSSDVLAVFPTRDSWETLLQDWWMSPSAVPEGFAGTLAVGLPLFPDNGSMEAAARGDDDEKWTEMGALIAARYPDAWIRPGWEMNIPNWPWAATPENVESYKQAFRRAATALKRGGPQLRVVFNPNEGRGGSLPDARLAYPGDDVVDTIGIDAYDWYPSYAGGGWQEHRTKDQGWDFWMRFAREHGKTFAVPEWGVMTGSEASGGDNPEYIEAVLAWMAENADVMAFDAYFEEPEDYCKCALSLNPRAQQAYVAALDRVGNESGVARTPATADPTPGAPEIDADEQIQPAEQVQKADSGQAEAPGQQQDRAVPEPVTSAPPDVSRATAQLPAQPLAADESGLVPSAGAITSSSEMAPERMPGRGRFGRDPASRVLPSDPVSVR